MNWRSSRFFLPLLIFLVVLIIGGGFVVAYIRTMQSSITIIWQAAKTSFTSQDQQDIQSAWKTALLTSNGDRLSGHEFTITSAQRQGDWAIFSANERESQDAEPIPTEPLFFLAHHKDTAWVVWLPSSPDFCNQLELVPVTLLNPTDKRYFC